MKIIILIVVALLLASCTSTRELMDSWVGHSKQSLILKWGPPERVASDGGDGEVCVYSQQIYMSNTRSVFYRCTMFYLDNSNKIYHWMVQTSAVPPQQMNITFY